MKILTLFCIASCLAFSKSHVGKEADLKRKAQESVDPTLPFVITNEKTVTAKEVDSGLWVPDEEGGCDLVKGCAYRNKETGEVGFLPESEKKKLKEKKEEAVPQSGAAAKLTELKDKASWDEKFDTEKNKKGLVLIFSAADCGPCKALKSKLENEANPGVALFTAVRPTYRAVQGHQLHEAFKGSLGGSVPVAFIYTQDENGKWNGKVVKGNQIYPAIEAIK